MENKILENYHDRLKEVLQVSGKLDENDLSYCKLLAIDKFESEKDKGCACYGNNAVHKCNCK
jgi:hypothetical protein